MEKDLFTQIIKEIPSVDYGIRGLEVHRSHTKEGTMYFVTAHEEVQVREFALQEKHHGEVTQAIIDKYAPKEEKVTTEPKKVYVCSVCGFEYEGDIDKEGDDYKCPICGCKKGVFKLQ